MAGGSAMTWSDSYITVHSRVQRGRKGTGRAKVANNTYLEERGAAWGYGDPIALRLHNTDILTYTPEGITYNTGGWQTVTTKARMNDYGPLYLTQKAHRWYYRDGSGPITMGDRQYAEYIDGMRVGYDGTILSAPPTDLNAEAKRKATEKAIDAYCTLIRKTDVLPMPNAGDCLICQITRNRGNASGTEHLTSHLEESYVVGSLLWAALREKGYPHPELIFRMPDMVARAVKSYLRVRLIDGRVSV